MDKLVWEKLGCRGLHFLNGLGADVEIPCLLGLRTVSADLYELHCHAYIHTCVHVYAFTDQKIDPINGFLAMIVRHQVHAARLQ